MSIIPDSIDEITPKWLGGILKMSIKTENFSLESNTQVGNGYLSNLVRVSFKTESDEELSIVIKFQPEDLALRSLLVANEWDKREISSYENLIPALIQIHPPLKKYIPKYYFGTWEKIQNAHEEDYKSMLILEDLCKFGYEIVQAYGEKNVSDDQMKDGLEILANIHFGGEMLEKSKNKALDELFPMFKLRVESQIAVFLPILFESYAQLFPLIESSSNKNLVKEYKEIEPYLEVILTKVLSKMDGDVKSVIHGDLWSNNVMFNSNNNFVTKVIDWQLVDYRDCCMDVLLWIVTNLTTFNVHILEKWMTYYTEYFDGLAISSNIKDYRKKREGAEFFEFGKTYGISYCFLWYVLSTIGLIGKDDERLLRAYEFYQEMGVFKFLISISKD